MSESTSFKINVYYKNNFRWILHLNVKCKGIKHLNKKIPLQPWDRQRFLSGSTESTKHNFLK